MFSFFSSSPFLFVKDRPAKIPDSVKMLFYSKCENSRFTPNLKCNISESNSNVFGSGLTIVKDNKDVKKIKYIQIGTFNATYNIGNNLVLRLTRPNNNNKNTENNELFGLYYQGLISKSRSDGGFNCPYICKVYDFGKYIVNDIKGINRIFKELLVSRNYKSGAYGIIDALEGGELFDKIVNEYYKLSVDIQIHQLRLVVYQILKALECMHHHGYCHLDLKPENIMLCNTITYDIKLIDFGMVYNFTDHNNIINSKVGSDVYTAPEMHKEIFQSINDKCDIWAIGIIMLVMLISEYPTKTSNYYAYSQQTLDSIKDDYDEDLYIFIENVLKVDPSERWDVTQCLSSDFIKKDNIIDYLIPPSDDEQLDDDEDEDKDEDEEKSPPIDNRNEEIDQIARWNLESRERFGVLGGSSDIYLRKYLKYKHLYQKNKYL